MHWGPEGDEISGLELVNENLSQMEARLTPDGAGGAIFTWVDERFGATPHNDLYAQRVNASGTKLWGDEGGIVISNAPFAQNGNLVRMLGEETVAILWFDYRNGSPGLYLQRLDLDGDILDADNGVEVVFGVDADAAAPRVVAADEDHYFVGWTDIRYTSLGTYAYAQKISYSDGAMLWGKNGINLTPDFPVSSTDTLVTNFLDARFVSDGQGGMIAVWSDTRDNPIPLLYTQRIDNDGTPLWGGRGKLASYQDGSSYRDQQSPRLIETGDGGAIIVYHEYDADYLQQVKVQRLDANGDYMWSGGSSAGVFVTSGFMDHFIETVNRFSDGSLLVVYSPQSEFPPTYDLYAVRVNLDGSIAWTQPLPICTAPDIQFNAKSTPVEGGVVVFWEDQRRGNPILDIYGQLIHMDGTLAWAENGAVLVEADNGQDNIALASESHSATNFWAAWRDASDSFKTDIILARFDLDGNALHTTRIGTDDHSQLEPVLVLDGEGGVFVAWREEDRATYSDLMVSHVTDEGILYNPEYYPTGAVLTSAYHIQREISAISDGSGGMVGAWVDARSTGKEPLSNIYTQRIADEFMSVGERGEAQPIGWGLHAAYPNPFNPSTTIRFEVAKNAAVKLAVYDVLGREVVRLVDREVSAGSHQVFWNGQDISGATVASGTYFYRLETSDFTFTRSMVLLK